MDNKTPAYVVQSLDQARAALLMARDFPCAPLLLSTPGYAAVMGAAVFQAMMSELTQEFPDNQFTSALDCGDAAGHALTAIRLGVSGIVLTAHPEAFNRIKDMAAQSNCVVYSPAVYDNAHRDTSSDTL